MKRTLILTAALIGGIALPAVTMAETFPGAEATNCDPARFTPVYGEDGVTILYWNNPTCSYAGSGGGTTLIDRLDASEEAAES